MVQSHVSNNECVVQRNVSLKTESATKLASMVQEVTGKASEALFNLNVDLQHLPKKQMTSQVDVLTPLHVLFQQFCNIRAIYEDQLQVAEPSTRFSPRQCGRQTITLINAVVEKAPDRLNNSSPRNNSLFRRLK